MMLRAPEVGCARLAAVINGTVAAGMDLSNHVSDLHESLIKVLIGTNEENVKIAQNALLTMYRACNKEDSKLTNIPEHLRNGFKISIP